MTPFQLATELFDQLSTEVYYGYNLKTVLAKASVAERDAIRAIIARAKLERSPLEPLTKESPNV